MINPPGITWNAGERSIHVSRLDLLTIFGELRTDTLNRADQEKSGNADSLDGVCWVAKQVADYYNISMEHIDLDSAVSLLHILQVFRGFVGITRDEEPAKRRIIINPGFDDRIIWDSNMNGQLTKTL